MNGRTYARERALETGALASPRGFGRRGCTEGERRGESEPGRAGKATHSLKPRLCGTERQQNALPRRVQRYPVHRSNAGALLLFFKFGFAVVFCLFCSFPPLHSSGGIVDARSTSNGRRSARHRVWAGGKNRDGLGRCLGKAHAAASRETRAALAGAKLDPCETRPARFQLALLLVIYTCVVLFFRNAIHRYVLPIFFRSPLRCFVRF